MQKIRLYLGAHKTATTHVQGILLSSRAVLAERGVSLSCPQDLRKSWLPQFFEAQQALTQTGTIPAALADSLRSWLPPTGDWILSEENIIGTPYELTRFPGLYPFAARRIATLQTLFPEVALEFHFSLRAYDSFYRSMYSEVIRNRGYLPFDQFYDKTRYATNSWLTFIRNIARVIPPDAITLWRFEDFRALQDRIIGGLTGQSDTAEMIARYAPTTTRPSLSQKTVDLLADLAPAIGAQGALGLTETINRHFSVETGHAPLSVFGREDAAVLQRAYAEDVEAICAEFPSLRMYSPHPAFEVQ